jgi:hypothetical protein
MKRTWTGKHKTFKSEKEKDTQFEWLLFKTALGFLIAMVYMYYIIFGGLS